MEDEEDEEEEDEGEEEDVSGEEEVRGRAGQGHHLPGSPLLARDSVPRSTSVTSLWQPRSPGWGNETIFGPLLGCSGEVKTWQPALGGEEGEDSGSR